MPFFVDVAHYIRIRRTWLTGLNCYVRPLPLTYPVRYRASNSGRSLRQRRFPESRGGSMTNVPPVSSPTDPQRAAPGSLNDADNIAWSEWPDDTRADTPRPCHWSARRMDGIRGFRRLAALWNAQEGCAAAGTCVIRPLIDVEGVSAT